MTILHAEWWEILWLVLAVGGVGVALWDFSDAWADWRYVRRHRLRVLRRVARASVFRAALLTTAMAACGLIALAFMRVPPLTQRNFETVGGVGGIIWVNIVLLALVYLDGWTRRHVTSASVEATRAVRERSPGPPQEAS